METPLVTTGDENCYQISDDEYDENENGQDDLLEECETSQTGRGSHERAWTTEATRALIHIRGPMDDKFHAGRHKRTTLWLHVTKQLQKLGYMYSAAKVQKKWHNILITYNKNIGKKYESGYVHWEFFEEMFKYLQGKKATYDRSAPPTPQDDGNQQFSCDDQSEWKHDMDHSFEPKKMKYIDDLPLEITHDNNSSPESDSNWWKDYFDKKLQSEKEKIQLQKEMHKDLMNFNKMSLIQQEKIERIKIDAINNLTATLQKLVEVKNKKC